MTTIPMPDSDVGAFIQAVPDERRRADARVVLDLLRRTTGYPPVMWGPSIVGFGSYHYRYASGREGDFLIVGFSPRKAATTVYLYGGFEDRTDVLARLGPHSIGKGCLYLKRVTDIDLAVLEELIMSSVQAAREVDTGPQ